MTSKFPANSQEIASLNGLKFAKKKINKGIGIP